MEFSPAGYIGCGDHIVQLIGGRIDRRPVDILPVVSRCCHKKHGGIPDGAVQGLVIGRRSKAQIADRSSVVLRIADGLDESRCISFTVPASQSLHRHELHPVPRDHPRDPNTIAGGRPDGTGPVSAVAVLGAIIDLVIVMVKIPAVHIVRVSVSVVIQAVSRDLILIDPDSSRQILMGNIHSGIDDGHHHVPLSLSVGGPGIGHPHIDPGRCPDPLHLDQHA